MRRIMFAGLVGLMFMASGVARAAETPAATNTPHTTKTAKAKKAWSNHPRHAKKAEKKAEKASRHHAASHDAGQTPAMSPGMSHVTGTPETATTTAK